ncbi:MAG: transcriptional repressor [Anaerolineae bacterium]|nr:transcriptional repressor [Anaerolineae bacterium]MCO5196883.1 transcriptional repressor [Anaerolineae bacterium]MCO5204269.1 transcriptional repressor [Anaerolineae bacterium]
MTHTTTDYATTLRSAGHRLTPQREIILDALCDLGRHTAIGDLYQAVHATTPTIDLATVYRTMNLFAELGIVVSAEIDGQTVYEVAASTPHHHLICRSCGSVTTLSHHHFRQLEAHLNDEHGFLADIDHITIHGLCANCR